MQSSLKIGNIMDIPIKLDTSFLLALPISAYFFAINSQPYGFAGIEPTAVMLALRCFVWVTSIHLLNTEVAYPISRNTCC